MAIGAYRGKMTLLPAIQASLVQAGQRIDATENAVRSWARDRDEWRKHAEARVYGAVRAVRQQAKQIAAVDGQLRDDQLQSSRGQEPIAVQTPPGDDPSAKGVSGGDRKDFDLPVHSQREVAPGVWIAFNNTDVARQRCDGRLWLAPDRHEIGIHSQGVQRPLEFPLNGDGRRAELVVTRVTKGTVTGYLMLPRHDAAAAVSSAAD
jgi:hypothetical protein